jgi:hypothetical protein
MISLALLVVFIFSGLVYARSSKALIKLDKIRLEKEPPASPDTSVTGAATEFARRIGIPMAPGGDELKGFCERHGLSAEYHRANRSLFGAIIVALACGYIIIKLGPMKL